MTIKTWPRKHLFWHKLRRWIHPGKDWQCQQARIYNRYSARNFACSFGVNSTSVPFWLCIAGIVLCHEYLFRTLLTQPTQSSSSISKTDHSPAMRLTRTNRCKYAIIISWERVTDIVCLHADWFRYFLTQLPSLNLQNWSFTMKPFKMTYNMYYVDKMPRLCITDIVWCGHRSIVRLSSPHFYRRLISHTNCSAVLENAQKTKYYVYHA
jgi:hypothetical protein